MKKNDIRLNYKMRALRLALGLTQEEVGELIGCSNVVISLYERGVTDSSFAHNIASTLYGVKQRMVDKNGYWYDCYIELQTALHEMQVWQDMQGYVPEHILKNAKTLAAAFSNS